MSGIAIWITLSTVLYLLMGLGCAVWFHAACIVYGIKVDNGPSPLTVFLLWPLFVFIFSCVLLSDLLRYLGKKYADKFFKKSP